MTDSKTEAAEMEKLIERLSPMQCDCDGEHTDACYSFGKIYEYIQALQSRNRVLEEDWKRMRGALENVRDLDLGLPVGIACLGCKQATHYAIFANDILSSLHHSPASDV